MSSRKPCLRSKEFGRKYPGREQRVMPHIVFNGRVDLDKIYLDFKPIFTKKHSLIKIKDAYLNGAKNNLLLSSLVIDDFHQEFFIEILSNDEKTTIRLYPLTDPKKTDSVRNALVLVARIIQKNYPDIPIGKTNLQDYLSNQVSSC